MQILGPRPFAKPVDYDSFVGRFEKDRNERTKAQREKDSDKKEKPKDPADSDVGLELA